MNKISKTGKLLIYINLICYAMIQTNINLYAAAFILLIEFIPEKETK